jgi:hypothetical protein
MRCLNDEVKPISDEVDQLKAELEKMKDYVQEKKRKARDIECDGQGEVGKRFRQLIGEFVQEKRNACDIECDDQEEILKRIRMKLLRCENGPVPIDMINIMAKPQDADDESCISTLSSASRPHFRFDKNSFKQNVDIDLKLSYMEEWVLEMITGLQQVQEGFQKLNNLCSLITSYIGLQNV